MKIRTPGIALVTVIASLFLAALTPLAQGVQITVPDASFASPSTAVTGSGTIITPSYSLIPANQGIPSNTNAWHVDGDAVLNLLLAPKYSFGNGEAGFSGLLTVNVLGSLLANGGQIYDNNIGTNYAASTQYTLTVDFTSTSLLSADVLSQSGAGIALLSGGTLVASTPASLSLANVTIGPDQHSGTFSLAFSSGANIVGTAIGVKLFVGNDNGLISANLLPNIAFTDVALDAQLVPEPSSWMLAGLGCLAFLPFCRRRIAHRKVG